MPGLINSPNQNAAATIMPEGAGNIRRFVAALANNLNIKSVDQVNAANPRPQYSLSYNLGQEHIHFLLSSNQPHFQMLVGTILVHERGKVADGMREHPEIPLRFAYSHTRLQTQWAKRLSAMTDYVERADDKLVESMRLMQELFDHIPYSPETALEEVANFATRERKFHLTLQPAPFFVFSEYNGQRSPTLVLGLNLIGTKILETAIKQHLIEGKAPCKERPLGLVADGNKALRELADFLLHDDARLNRAIEGIEQNYLAERQLRKPALNTRQ